MTYICAHMDANDERKISMPKLVCLADECHRPVPSGTKCASKLKRSSAIRLYRLM
jgi:hypothetical protein